MTFIPANLSKPVLHVKHADLKSLNDDSVYRRECPVCTDGMLLVHRDQKTFKLLPDDICTLCGQRVRYTDFGNIPGVHPKTEVRQTDIPIPFIQACIKGLTTVDQIYEWVDEWHRLSCKNNIGSMAKFLGMTDAEYSSWVTTPSALKAIVQAHTITKT